MDRILVAGVGLQRLDQRIGAEDVIAHRRVGDVRIVLHGGRVGRLLQESGDLVAGIVGVDDAERGGLVSRHPDGGDGRLGAGLDVVRDHLRRIHPVDVVGAENDQVLGIVVVDQVQRLQDGVGTAGVPARTQPLLRRHRRHVIAEHLAHPPGGRDVPVERVRLVLRQHADSQVPGIHQIRQHEVDEPEISAERNGWLCAVGGQRPQPLSLTTGENDAENSGFDDHGTNPIRPPHTSLSGCLRSPVRLITMRTAILTREFPPDIYGGAGVHVDYLVRELRKLIDIDVHAFGDDRPGAFGHQPAPDVADANPALATLSVDLSMAAACGRRRPGPFPHLVREHGRARIQAAVRHPACGDGALARAAPPVEGRAARRWVPAVQLGREDRLRGSRRRRRGLRRHAGRHPGLLPGLSTRRRCT